MFPKTAICIERTDNAMQLAEIYTASDVFVNPTLEETFSLVNVESQACGCPVITYRSGGSVEMITEKTGVIVNKNDLAGMRDTIGRMASGELVFSAEDCIENASHYALANMYDGYLKLYHRVLGDAE
jgi:glycosyltransferase involved in cell wall biosynthesis